MPSNEPENKARDWPEIREWANLAIALTALLVGVVTFWTTTQISGLEDYFRSEISQRNSDLEDATYRARQLDDRLRVGQERLAELQVTADRLAAANNEAQSRIVGLQSRSFDLLTSQQRTERALSDSQDQLALTASQIADQQLLVEKYRREDVLAHARRTFRYLEFTEFLRGESSEYSNTFDGPFALKELSNFGLGVTSVTHMPYYEAIRTRGVALCRRLESYSPDIPKVRAHPKLGPRPGRVDKNGVRWMTSRETERWNAQFAAWNEKWDQTTKHNNSIREARRAIEEYIVASLNSCACRSIAVEGDQCPAMPERPNLANIIETQPI